MCNNVPSHEEILRATTTKMGLSEQFRKNLIPIEALVAAKVFELFEKIENDDHFEYYMIPNDGYYPDISELIDDINEYLKNNKIDRYSVRERVRNIINAKWNEALQIPFTEDIEVDFDGLNDALFDIVPDEEV